MQLEKFAPQLLCAYPSALETLVRYLRDSGRRLSIPAVVTSSEVFRPEAWALVEQMLGCRLADYYGQAERIAFASANAAGEYRFQHAYSCVEFIPYDGQRVPTDSAASVVRDRRDLVLEQPVAHRALSHRRSGAPARELGRT